MPSFLGFLFFFLEITLVRYSFPTASRFSAGVLLFLIPSPPLIHDKPSPTLTL